MSKEIEDFVAKLDDDGVWKLYSTSIKELRRRRLIRTKNIVGERGEYLTIKFYNSKKGEPKLQRAPPGTKNVDALSVKGDRYNIKTVTAPRRITGAFWGLNPPGSEEKDRRIFEFLIIVVLDEDLELKEILEVSWELFLENKTWSKRMKTWRVPLTNEFKTKCRVVFRRGM
jgi:hypothetical protein